MSRPQIEATELICEFWASKYTDRAVNWSLTFTAVALATVALYYTINPPNRTPTPPTPPTPPAPGPNSVNSAIRESVASGAGSSGAGEPARMSHEEIEDAMQKLVVSKATIACGKVTPQSLWRGVSDGKRWTSRLRI